MKRKHRQLNAQNDITAGNSGLLYEPDHFYILNKVPSLLFVFFGITEMWQHYFIWPGADLSIHSVAKKHVCLWAQQGILYLLACIISPKCEYLIHNKLD